MPVINFVDFNEVLPYTVVDRTTDGSRIVLGIIENVSGMAGGYAYYPLTCVIEVATEEEMVLIDAKVAEKNLG